jgi:hypothetical protein
MSRKFTLNTSSQDDFSRISWTSEQLGKNKGEEGEGKTLEYLTSDIAAIEEDIKLLMETLNSTGSQLKDEKLKSKKNEEEKVFHEVEEEANKIIEDIQTGKIKIDYETGKLSGGTVSESGGGGKVEDIEEEIGKLDNKIRNITTTQGGGGVIDRDNVPVGGIDDDENLGNDGVVEKGGRSDVLVEEMHAGQNVGESTTSDFDLGSTKEIPGYVRDGNDIASNTDRLSQQTGSIDHEDPTTLSPPNVPKYPPPLPPINTPVTPKSPPAANVEKKEAEKRAEGVAKKVKEEVDKLRSMNDPAVMQVDVELLTDIVKLAITAAVFGLIAVNCYLPSTAGFLLGGMVIGPSYFALIHNVKEGEKRGEVKETRRIHPLIHTNPNHTLLARRVRVAPSLPPSVVQTLSQFGSIFLLFEQGLMYSIEYSRREMIEEGEAEDGGGGRRDEDAMKKAEEGGGVFMRSPPPNSNKRDRETMGGSYSNDAPEFLRPLTDRMYRSLGFAGLVLFVVMLSCTICCLIFLENTSGLAELLVVASAVALTSSTVVSESLHTAHLKESIMGRKLLKIVAVQDLIMVPLLALPEIMHSLKHEGHEGETYKELFMRGLFVFAFAKFR